MRYSIIIPVFNKADLTKQCLDALPATIADAGEGEVIVVDNASSDHTQRVLAAYPWIRVITNERNLGFAAANNQAARIARGEFLVLLNNDTEPWPGWLASMLRHAAQPDVGAVGALLLYPNKTVQHGGVAVAGNPFGRQQFQPFHHNYLVPFEDPDVRRTQEFQIVTGACLLTPRALYERLGGLDEGYWNGYEDVDYCLKVGRAGMRVVYDGEAVLYHFESQSGIQRFRKTIWNTELLDRRWRGSVRFDAAEKMLARGYVRHPLRGSRLGGINAHVLHLRPINVVVHGEEPPEGRAAFERRLRCTRAPVGAIVWALGDDALATAREAMRIRGARFTAFVRGAAEPSEGWLDELVRQLSATPTTFAAAYAPEIASDVDNVVALAADGRCLLVHLMRVPAHMRLEAFDSLDASLADLGLRMLPLGFGTRIAQGVFAVPPVREDASFESRHGRPLAAVLRGEPEAVEAELRARPRRARGLVSIVTLSWNAPQYTKIALESIRTHTSEPYEVIVVDNGSGPETVSMLREIDDPHVRVIYNERNRGFGGGNNDGIAVARGEFVVVLNNDVVVTDGWLDSLLDPFDRIPSVGVTAPRTNKIVGDQQVVDASYADIEGMHAYAARRRRSYARRGYLTDRAIGFCLCIDRRVIEEIGGFDERFEMGNFEDDDFSVRVRAAGYEIYVCEDSFIHHFGSRSFVANDVDYASTMRENWSRFAEKWGYPDEFPTNGYDPRKAIYGGFDRARHFAPLPTRRVAGAVLEPGTVVPREYDVVFAAFVRDEADWGNVAEFTKRYFIAFDAEAPVTLAIAGSGDPNALTIARRVERTLQKLDQTPERCADVEIRDEEDLAAWRSSLPERVTIDIERIVDRSPSALRRLLRGVSA